MCLTNVSNRRADKSVVHQRVTQECPQECQATVSNKSAFEELWTRVPHQNAALKTSKSVWPKCNYITNMIRIPRKNVRQQQSSKRSPAQECLARVSHLMSHESVLQECLKKRVSKRVSQRFCDCHCCHSLGPFCRQACPVSSARMPENAWASCCLGMRCLMIVLWKKAW